MMYDNFVRIHQQLQVMPAMAAGLTGLGDRRLQNWWKMRTSPQKSAAYTRCAPSALSLICLLAAYLPAPAAVLPEFDVDHECLEKQPDPNSVRICVQTEQDHYEHLKVTWPKLLPLDQLNCVDSERRVEAKGLNYTSLDYCADEAIQMHSGSPGQPPSLPRIPR